MDSRKRGRAEPSADIEQRLINLIVKIGDKNVANITSHLEGLSKALEGDLPTHRDLIMDTIFDCTHWLQPKSAVYGTLVGLLNLSDPDFGSAVASRAQRELQAALDDHAPLAIRGLARFAVELANAHVVAPATALELIETFLRVREEEGVLPARRDWFVCLALDALVLCGKGLAAQLPTELEAVMGALRAYAAAREPLHALAHLMLPCGADTREDEVSEHFQSLWRLVSDISADGGWSSPLLLAPARAFAERFEAATAHPLPVSTVPSHTAGCTYPMLTRLRLLSAAAGGDGAMDVEGGGGGGASLGGSGLGAAERVILEEHTAMVAQAFVESHRDGAKVLAALQEAHAVDGGAVFVETLLSMMLALPRPRHPPLFYGMLLLDLSKLLTTVPPLLERAVHALFARLPALDAELRLRLADWLALHVSHFGYSLAPFGAKWAAAIREAGGALPAPPAEAMDEDAGAVRRGAVESAGEPGAQELFVRHLLGRMLRLAYHERLVKTVPAELLPLLPPKPEGRLAWADVRDGDLEPGSPPALSAALLGKLRSKEAHADVVAWLDALPLRAAARVELVLHSLLHAGNKSISHLEKLLEKFTPLLTHVAGDSAGRAALVAGVVSYWGAAPQLVLVALQKMLHHGAVDAAAVVAFYFAEGERRRLAYGHSWEVLHAVVESTLSRQRACAEALRIEERRAAEARRGGDDDDMDLGGDDAGSTVASARLARATEALDAARREKKALLANLFAGAGGALGAQAGAGGPEPAWRSVTLAHMRALGRRYLRELSLDTIEMVVEGAELDAAGHAQLFDPLKQLAGYLG